MELDPECLLSRGLNASFHQCLRFIEVPDYKALSLAIALALVALATIGGNLLIILTVALVDKLRTPCNLLIVNLALTDLLVGVLVMPLTIAHRISLVWPFGATICMLYISTDVILCTSSILCLCAISIDRYLAITRPFDYSLKRTTFLMFVMIFVSWFFSFAISIPPLFTWTFSYEQDPHSLSCQYSSDFYYQLYATVIAFYLPLLVMLVLYGRIFVLASRMAISHHKPPEPGLETKLTPDMQTTGGGENSNKAVITLGVILGCFTVCWLPFFVTQVS
ncbi:receptor [Cichlidogyrus casuarinus]|uniref:Receptor n=1 Tax=Cichlidogyrus casuarinus TaxID=1844966 RepID=A0ABD2PP03_9PLAT